MRRICVSLIGLVAAVLVLTAYLARPRITYTREETKAIASAKVASIRAGWWGDGYTTSGVSHSSRGWFVSFDYPGTVAGGHHGVWLDHQYRVVRLVGGK